MMDPGITDTQILPYVDPEVTECDGRLHYVRKQALIAGGLATALCGKRWVPTAAPTGADREICPMCAQLLDLLRLMDDV